MFRAQSTLEYLVIIGVVVVVSLVVAGLSLNILGGNGSVDEKSSKLYWGSQSLAVMDSQTDSNGNLLVVLRNNSSDFVTLDSIAVNGVVVYPDSFNLGGANLKRFF